MKSDLHTTLRKPGMGYGTLLLAGIGHMTHYAHPDKVLAAVESIAAQDCGPGRRNPVPARCASGSAGQGCG